MLVKVGRASGRMLWCLSAKGSCMMWHCNRMERNQWEVFPRGLAHLCPTTSKRAQSQDVLPCVGRSSAPHCTS